MIPQQDFRLEFSLQQRQSSVCVNVCFLVCRYFSLRWVGTTSCEVTSGLKRSIGRSVRVHPCKGWKVTDSSTSQVDGSISVVLKDKTTKGWNSPHGELELDETNTSVKQIVIKCVGNVILWKWKLKRINSLEMWKKNKVKLCFRSKTHFFYYEENP